MKANEAPERIYFEVNNNLIGLYDSAILGMFSVKKNKTAIEYIRKDAFIEKVCGWLKNFNDFHNIMRYSDCCEVPLEQIIENFEEYLKK